MIRIRNRFWPSKILFYLSLALGAALAILTVFLLLVYQPIVARGIVGAVVIAYLFGLALSQRLAEPVSPALNLPRDLKLALRNILISYYWLTILGLCAAFVYEAVLYLWRSLLLIVR